jgi:hypothetical protein
MAQRLLPRSKKSLRDNGDVTVSHQEANGKAIDHLMDGSWFIGSSLLSARLVHLVRPTESAALNDRLTTSHFEGL